MTTINWIPEDIIKANLEASLSRYQIIERDFEQCLEYIQLSEDNLNAYSTKFADLILRIGPEILRLFHIYLFTKKRYFVFEEDKEESEMLFKLQQKCDANKANFYDYFQIFDNGGKGQIQKLAIEIRPLNKFVLPFKTERKVQETKNGSINFTYLPWWQDGYNSLKHKIITDYKNSATYKNALFSLSGFRVIHEEFLARDWGTYSKLQSDRIFGQILEKGVAEGNGFSFL